MRWSRHATHLWNRGKTNAACIVIRKAETRAELAVTGLAPARRKGFGHERLGPLSLGSPTHIATAFTRSEALKFRL
jgi:hypothetical protein